MGIHVAIVAREQITDEKKWYEAIQEIIQFYKEKGILKMFPYFQIEYLSEDNLSKFAEDEKINFRNDHNNMLGPDERFRFNSHWGHWQQKPGLEFNEKTIPPILFELEVGERPRLPIFGRHFRACSSKIGYFRSEAEACMKRIFTILNRHFPGKLEYWDETNEEYETGDRYKLAPNSEETKLKFYEQGKYLFKNMSCEGDVLHAARELAENWNMKSK